ncbi:MAG: hypothetical protein ACFFED_10070 [Candidatus Thorarchaeota archaeon]
MSTKNTNARILLEDLKISFKFAVKNIISFILGMLGVLIVTGIMIAALAVIILVPVFLSGGLMILIDGITGWIASASTISGATAFLMILTLMVPILAPVLVAIGALFGMGREIVESEGTTAEGVFAWYSKKFFPLAAVGILQFLIYIAPIAILFAFLGPVSFGVEQIALASGVIALYAIYVAIMSGLLVLSFPAVIDGKSTINALKTAVRLSTTYFDRVFSVWLSFLGIALLLFLPIIGPPLLMLPSAIPTTTASLGFLAGYASLAFLFMLFILLPAVVIGMSRIYMILVSENLSDYEVHPEEELDDVNIFGGD